MTSENSLQAIKTSELATYNRIWGGLKELDNFPTLPSTPALRLDNYLDRLLIVADGLGAPIRVSGLSNFVKCVVRKTGTRQMERDFSISNACLRGWCIGRRAVPLPTLKKMIEMYYAQNMQVNAWEKIFESVEHFTSIGSPHRVSLPKFLTPELSYFIGYLYGDGCLSNAPRRLQKNGKLLCEIKIADFSYEHVKNMSKLFQKLFNVKASVRDERMHKGEQTFYIDPKCKVVHQFLNHVFGMPIGEKKGRLRVPAIILQADAELRKWFVAGFFDADGDTLKIERAGHKVRPRIRIKQASIDMLQDIKRIFHEDVQITIFGPYADQNGWSISTENRMSVKRFCTLIPSIHPVKSRCLKEVLRRLQ